MIYAIVAVLVLIADQAVKFWTTKNIVLGASGDDCVELIRGFVRMTNVHNQGAAFSILQGARWPLVVVTAVFVVVIIVLISREIIHTPFGRWTAILVMAGAIGNCIDRALYGYVVDMFEFEFFTFPVFNVADIFITVAGILFCIHLIVHNEPEAVKAANEPEFMRRRREAKAAKEAPFANIPKHGEHVSLEEEMRAADPNDLFAEWEFGGEIPPAPEPEPEPAPAEAAPEPIEEPPAEKAEPTAEEQQARDELFDAFLFEPGAEASPDRLFVRPETASEPEAASPAAPVFPPDPEPAPKPEAKPVQSAESFSLDEILAEFSDF